jgi:hypothetical protein
MTSKERVIGHSTFLRNKATSKIDLWEGKRDEVAASWKEDQVEFHRKMGCFDIVNLMAESTAILPPKDYDPERPKKIEEGVWEGPNGRVYKDSEVTQDILLVHDPEASSRTYTIENFEEEEPSFPEPSIFEVIDYVIQHLGKEKFIIGPSGTPVELVLLGTMEQALCRFLEDPELVKAAAKYYTQEGNLQDFIYIRPGTDGVMWGQDFAYKNGPLVYPAIFHEFLVPFAKERVRHVHDNFHIPVIKHACGNNWSLLDMFVEIGWDCYQSIQALAGMDLGEEKEKYGKRMALWGGVPVELLVSGTKEEVVTAAEQTMAQGNTHDKRSLDIAYPRL